MTTRAYDDIAPAPQVAAGRRTIAWAPFGWYTRYMLAAYFRHSLIVIGALLTVALTLDVSPRVEKLLAAAPQAHGIWAVTHIAYYIMMRSGDMIVPLTPIGCFLGTLWCEVTHTMSRERLMVWNSGRAPVQCLVPVLIFGFCMGAGLFSIESFVRPWIMSVQAAQRLGDHGVHLSRQFSPVRRWIAAGDDLVNAALDYGPPPVLRDVTIYRRGHDGRVAEVISAQSARPGNGPNVWIAHDVHYWKASAESNAAPRSATPDHADSGAEQRLLELELVLQVNPLWLSHFGVDPKFLPFPTLVRLAFPSSGVYSVAEYRTWLNVRFAQFFLPAGMALLATSFSLWLLAYRTRNEVLLGIALAGYIAHVVMKAALLMGDNGYIPPYVAGWLTPAGLWITSAALLTLITLRGFEAPFGDWRSVFRAGR
ncbi:MAG: LptF/LptG family permease [Variibacter sp.]|nr:LptF/LptG family permease [Variibacter sp.]